MPSHRRSTTVSLETYPFMLGVLLSSLFLPLPPLLSWETRVLYTLKSPCIFSSLFSSQLLSYQRKNLYINQELISVPDFFFYSHDLNALFRSDNVGRSSMLVFLVGKRVKRTHMFQNCWRNYRNTKIVFEKKSKFFNEGKIE